jgi:hypothetical protein
MTTGDDTIVRRYADAMQRRGAQIVLRRVTYINGVLPNPPILANAALDGPVAAGATTIAIRAEQADGRILAGDVLKLGTLGSGIVAATATAQAPGFDPANPTVPGFASVRLAQPLAAAIPDGTPITATWAADQLVWITETNFTLLQTNSQILAGDLNVQMAAFGVAQPNAVDHLIINGFTRSIVNVARSTLRGQTVAWILQAR